MDNCIELLARALTVIPPPVWSKVRLSYLNTVLPRNQRRARLEESYYFLCECQQCQADDDGLCDGCVLCQQCEAPLGLQQHSCPTCGQPRPDEILSETQIFFQDLDNLQLIKAHRTLKKTFHVYDHRMFEFCERVMAACLSEEEFVKFYDIGERMLPAYKRYFSPMSVSLGLHLAKLAKMAIYLDKKEEAVRYLGQSCDILRVSHGEDSVMMDYMMSLRDTLSV